MIWQFLCLWLYFFLIVPQLGDSMILPPTRAWTSNKPGKQPESLKELTELQAELSSGTSKHKHCIFSRTYTKTTFIGGLKAGTFTNKGVVTSIGICKGMCCKDKKCDVAVMMKNACFLLACKSQELCKPRKAHLDHFALKLAYRNHTAETYLEGILKKHSK